MASLPLLLREIKFLFNRLKDCLMSNILKIAITEREAAKALSMSPDAFVALVKEGIIPPPIRLGKLERYSPQTLNDFMMGKIKTKASYVPEPAV
jgi:predicted DNA-binding transcriptional regulator AlpA